MTKATIAMIPTTTTTRYLRADASACAGRLAAPACMAPTRIGNAPDLFVNEAEAFLAHRAGRRSSAPVAAGAVLTPKRAPTRLPRLPTLGVVGRRPT